MTALRLILVATGILLVSTAARAVELPGPLVETAWLAEHRDEVFILDVRADTKSFTQRPRYVKNKKTGKRQLVALGGHVPGARLLDFKEARTTRVIDGRKIEKLVPPKERFEQVMRKTGLDADDSVVIVTKGLGSGDMTMAARMYWQLKYFGHDRVAVLNGGLAQWLTEERDYSTRVAKADRGDWRARGERRELLATSEDVAEAVESGSAQLIDNRPISLYLGTWKKDYVAAKGHIPGAKSFPNELMTDVHAPSKYLATEELRHLARELDVEDDRPAITYCNSGHLAAGGWFILSEVLGNENVKLYDGSMHQWTMENRPVVRFERQH
ncbi:MAG: sulfurtransferase [Gammaproteobacteria bacterium]|nr:sulfurtransferase [Gammaproteobacteria bacterium]